VTSAQIKSLPKHLRSPEVTWCHFLHVTASSCELQPCRRWNVQYMPVSGPLKPLPGDFRSNDVTFGELSRDVISRHVSCSCELQPCRKWNVQHMPVFGPLEPPADDFCSNEVSSGTLPVTWGHVTSFPSRDCLLRDTALLEVKCTVYGSFRPSKPLPGDFRSNDVTSGLLPISWGQVTSFRATWLPPPASYSLLRGEIYSICQFLAIYCHFQVSSGDMTSLPGHLRSPEVTWRHFLSRGRFLLRATAL